MSQLKLLWKLQNHDIRLNEIKMKLTELDKKEDIAELCIRLKQQEYDLINKKTQLEVNRAKIQRYNQKLKEMNFILSEVNDKLYSGEVSNFKRLSELQDKERELKNELDIIETEILSLLEEIESSSLVIEEMEERFQSLNEQLQNSKAKYEKEYDLFSIQLKNEEQSIRGLLDKLDDALINKYEAIKTRKVKAVAKVAGDRCNGCHMNIPLSTLSKIKHNTSLIYCDNCGRILFYEKQEEKND